MDCRGEVGLRWVRGDGDRSLARSREAAKGAKGMGDVLDMIYMNYMIVDELGLGIGPPGVRGDGDRSLARSREGANGGPRGWERFWT